MGIRAWFERQRQWRREHIAAFAAVADKHDDGLTAFQHNAISALATLVEANSYLRRVMPDDLGECLIAPLGNNGAVLWIYVTDAGIFGVKPHSWFEEWDYRTPDDLLKALVAECVRRTSNRVPNRTAAG